VMVVYAIAGSYTVNLDTKQDSYISDKASVDKSTPEVSIVNLIDKYIEAKEESEFSQLFMRCHKDSACRDKFIKEMNTYFASLNNT